MITKREFDMLVLLTETKEVVSQRDMAERLNISAEAVNKTVKELTEKTIAKWTDYTGRSGCIGTLSCEESNICSSRLWKPDGADHFEYA